jgi:competence protein ComEC
MKNFKPVALLLLLTLSSVSVAQSLKVHFINVGQGAATLFEFPCGVILVDTGGENNGHFNSNEQLNGYMEEFFDSHPEFKKTIDLLVITHPHKDHTSGIRDLVGAYTIKNVITNGQESGSGRWDQVFLHKEISRREEIRKADTIRYLEAWVDDFKNTGFTNTIVDPLPNDCKGINPRITLLWGSFAKTPKWKQAEFNNENNHSVAMKIEYGEASVFLTGDMEVPAIKSMMEKYDAGMFDTDIYLAGHHGSLNGTTTELIRAIKPEMSVIAVGDTVLQSSWTAWAYGHPNKSLVNMLALNTSGKRARVEVPVGNGAKKFMPIGIEQAIYATAWDGDIVLEGTKDGKWAYVDPHARPKININEASEDKLMELPSIGAARAEAIVKRRGKRKFENIEELTKIKGIGAATFLRIKDLIDVK